MKEMKPVIAAAIVMLCGLCLMAGCSSRGQGTTAVGARVAGTLEGPLGPDSAPAHVLEAIERAERLHCYEIMSDTAHALCVEAIGAVDTLAAPVALDERGGLTLGDLTEQPE